MSRNRVIQTALAVVFLIYMLQAFSPLRLVGDGMDYLLQASSAADGSGFYVHGQKSMRPSGYPLLIVGLIKMGMGKPWAIVALNCFFLALGCLATYLISRKAFELKKEGASLVCLLTMLSFVIVRQAAQPLSDICFFGLSAICLLLIIQAEEHKENKWWVLGLAGVLLAFCIEVRTIGIALVPPFLWVLFGGTPTFSRIPDWTRKHRVACFGILLVAGSVMILAGRQALHSRYLQFTEPIFVNRGFARSLWANLTDHSKEWGEIILNLPVSKLPRGMAIPVQLLGLLALLIFSVVLWQQRKKFTVVLCYISAFSAIVLAYPWFDTRLWLPVLPFIFIYLFMALKGTVNATAFRTVIMTWCLVYALCGLAGLAYSTRLTFLSPESFAKTYGDGNLRAAYRVVYQGTAPNEKNANADAIYLLRRYR